MAGRTLEYGGKEYVLKEVQCEICYKKFKVFRSQKNYYCSLMCREQSTDSAERLRVITIINDRWKHK